MRLMSIHEIEIFNVQSCYLPLNLLELCVYYET